MSADAPTGRDAHKALDGLCRHLGDIAGIALPRRVRLSAGGAEVEVEWPGDPTGEARACGPEGGPSMAPADDRHFLCAPMVGTFYRCSEPGARPFVQVGDRVDVGQQIGILEAMKLMNPVEADVAGRVVEILVDSDTPVEYLQPLVALAREEGG